MFFGSHHRSSKVPLTTLRLEIVYREGGGNVKSNIGESQWGEGGGAAFDS